MKLEIALALIPALNEWKIESSNSAAQRVNYMKYTPINFNPFTTEARFYVLNAIAFST